MSDRVRVMRILIYDGDREWVEETISRSIKGTMIAGRGRFIRAVTVSEFPEIIEDQMEDVETSEQYNERRRRRTTEWRLRFHSPALRR